jgi:branched-subunit amino acid ABC-type transport system permease component
LDSIAINLYQVFFNGILTGSIYILAAVGLTLTYGLLRFPNVAHAEFFTFGAYVALVVEETGLGLVWGGLAASILSGILGIVSYLMVFRPLAKRGATPIHLTIASLAYGLFLRYGLQQVWSGGSFTYKSWFQPFSIGAIRCTFLWLWAIATAAIFVLAFHIALTKTRIGKAIRGMSNNPLLAMSCGIDLESMLIVVGFLGGALAGVGGMFRAADTRLIPVLGWELLIPSFAVVILGGIGSFYGVIAAAYVIGLTESFAVLMLSFLGLSTEYKSVVAFIIIVVVLIFKPEGLAGLKTTGLGKKIRHG